MLFRFCLILSLLFSSALIASAKSSAQDNILHIYSSRYYEADQAIYDAFTASSGIKIELTQAQDDGIIARLQQEGDFTKADLLITVDAARLWRAQQAGLLQTAHSDFLLDRIPPHLRDPENQWFGFSTRVRAIFYNKDALDGTEIQRYEQLADPRWKNKICMRSSSHIYNLSLLAGAIEKKGEERAKGWARGVNENLARKPQGGDKDQLRALAAGTCDIAVANSYYYVRLQESEKQADRAVAENIGIIFPDQGAAGAHLNISGAGITKHADNPEAALIFLEYLASDKAQRLFPDGNHEYPAVASVPPSGPLQKLGNFQASPLNVSLYGENMLSAMKIFNEVGFP